MKELTENYCKTGTDNMSDFYNILDTMDSRTSYRKIRMDLITLLHICDEYDLAQFSIDPNIVPNDMWPIIPMNPRNEVEEVLLLNKNRAVPNHDPSCAELKKEIESMGALVSFDDGGTSIVMPLSAWAYKDLADRTGILCANISKKSINKSRWLSENLTEATVTLTIRESEDGSMKKIFAVRGRVFEGQNQGPFIRRAQTILEKDIGLGIAECRHWEITNESINVVFTFPEKTGEIRDMYPELPDDITPIVDIYTSDVGKSAFHVTSGFMIGKTRIVSKDGTVCAEHNKHFKMSSVMKKVQDCIFKQYNAVPKELARLLGIELTDMAAAIDEVINFTGIEKRAGMKYVVQHIKTLLCTELSLGTYTAYDLVTALISSPSRLVMTKKVSGDPKVVPESTLKVLNEALSKAIYCPFECETVDYDLTPEE